MRARVVCMLSVLAGCWGDSRGPVAPAAGGGDDLDLVLADSTAIGGVDIAHGLQAAIFAPSHNGLDRDALERKVRAATAKLSDSCKIDLLGSTRTIVFGTRNSGTIGSLIAHGVPTDQVRACLTGPRHEPVAVVSDSVYRVALGDAELEIRLVDRDATWLRWAPQGTLAAPASTHGDPNGLRPLLAHVDRSASAWVVVKPSAAELRDSWSNTDLPPPVGFTASIRFGEGVSIDGDYYTASPADAQTTFAQLRSQLELARTMFQLELAVRADGDALHVHAAANRATIERLIEVL